MHSKPVKFRTDLPKNNFSRGKIAPNLRDLFLVRNKSCLFNGNKMADLIILILKYYDIQVEFGLRLRSISKVYSCNLPEK